MASSTSPTMLSAKNPIAFLSLPTEIRQEILLQTLTNEDFKATIELKAYKVLPVSGSIPRYQAKWQTKTVPVNRPTNPRVMLCTRTTARSPLADFACRWNVPAPLFELDYEYIDKKWKEKQADVGVEMIDAWSEMFGSQFCINWVENFKPHVEDEGMIVGSREVSPLGSNIFIEGGCKRMRRECPAGILNRDLAKALGPAVRRQERCIPEYSLTVHVKGFIKVDKET
ncbi:hypothetical protein EG327_001553 [Venturia inaequalis]|uniref:Uncharacterized protein n=1 Tax=Venturia inaequalis TaxID=5025 RepID=A0A8H3VP31_VENIN|nr:hypothetical protein EG327_001553 [Venturia inaequalis]